MGLSTDPAKRRRQLEGLALGAERRAASLRSTIAKLEEPGSSEADQRGSSEARVDEAPSVAPAAPGIVVGAYPDPPAAPAAPPADVAPPAAVDELEHDDEPEPTDPEPGPELVDEERPEPGRGVKLAAQIFGVKS